MKQLSIVLIVIGLLMPAQTTHTLSDLEKKIIITASSTALLAYISGNVYARLIERAAHYRFDNEMDHLQHINPSPDVIQEILQNHDMNIRKGFFTRLCERIQLLPTGEVEPELLSFPLLQHRRDLDSYLLSVWWAQWWTLFTQKYNDLNALYVCLDQLKKIVISDYRYTREQQRINGYLFGFKLQNCSKKIGNQSRE